MSNPPCGRYALPTWSIFGNTKGLVAACLHSWVEIPAFIRPWTLTWHLKKGSPLEKEIHNIGNHHFLGSILVFRGVDVYISMLFLVGKKKTVLKSRLYVSGKTDCCIKRWGSWLATSWPTYRSSQVELEIMRCFTHYIYPLRFAWDAWTKMTNIFPEKWWRWKMWKMVMTPMVSNPYKNHLKKKKANPRSMWWIYEASHQTGESCEFVLPDLPWSESNPLLAKWAQKPTYK